jgi:hypothetical protein
MKKDRYDDMLVCHIQNVIQDIIVDLISIISKEEKLNIEDFVDKLSSVYELSKTAEFKGQKMENRMREYRQAIEKLGFKRVRTKKTVDKTLKV